MADLPETSTTHITKDDVKDIAEAVVELIKPDIDARLDQITQRFEKTVTPDALKETLANERQGILKAVDDKLAPRDSRLHQVEQALTNIEGMFNQMTSTVGNIANASSTNTLTLDGIKTTLSAQSGQFRDLLTRMRTSEEQDREIRQKVVGNQEALTARVVDVESRSALMVTQQTSLKGDILEMKSDVEDVQSDVKALSQSVSKMNESLIEHTTRAMTTRKFVAGLIGAVIALGGNLGLEFLSQFIQ